MAMILRKAGKALKVPRPKAVEEVSLPERRSEPLEDLLAYSVLIYGQKKIGKTSLAAQFPGALFFMCEPGGKALSIFQVAVRNWKEFKAYSELACKDDRFKTIVIDTADFSYDFCLEYVCDKMGMDHPSDEGYGKGWKAVKREYTDEITKLIRSGKGVVFISHAKDEEFKTRRDESYNKVGSSMSGQAKDVLEGIIDVWVYYYYDGKRRMLQIQGSDEVDAGHRVEGRFLYPDGEPIDRIPMGSSAKEAYRNLVDAFNNHAEKAEEKTALPRKKLRLPGR